MPSSARDIIVVALTVPLPAREDEQVRVAERAALIEAALIEHGHLPKPYTAPTDEEVEDTARWLATESQFPRYTVEAGPDTPPGWRRLMASTTDVNVAAAKALTLAVTDAYRDDVIRAKHTLLAWHHAHSALSTDRRAAR